MKDLERLANPFDDDKVTANCGIFGMMSLTGRTFSGKPIIEAMANMHERGNGLGGGFAAYGIYPEYRDYRAFHLMFESQRAREETEAFLKSRFVIVHSEEIPHKKTQAIKAHPMLFRYFTEPAGEDDSDDYIVGQVMTINREIDGAFVFSSGKDMGVFKGVGHAEDIGEFYQLGEYQGYLWTAHSRFPTNTQAWWGGAHPFSILDWTVVHNGEISSYGTNRNFLEMNGYYCTLHTDTEVMAYACDLLLRRNGLPVEVMASVLAPPFWSEIDRMPEKERNFYSALRFTYPELLMNGPFAVVIAHHGEMIGLRDRVNLRPLIAGIGGDTFFLSSEEAPIHLVCPDVERTWAASGGVPVVGRVGMKEPIYGIDLAMAG